MFAQIIPLVLSMFIEVSQKVLAIFVLVNLFVVTMFTQVNLFVEMTFVKVNLFALSIYIHIYIYVDSTLLIQQLFFIFSLPFLIFPFYYKYSIILINIFMIFLTIVILTSKLTCLRKFFILYISRNSTFLRFNLNTCITFKSLRTTSIIKTSEVSFLLIVNVSLLY